MISAGADEQAIPEDLDPARLREALLGRIRIVGRALDVHACLGSTMEVAADALRAGAKEGLVVIADQQVAGRGRLGRTWVSPPRGALALSIVFRPRCRPERLSQVPMAVGLGALDALADHTPDRTPLALKWPNDLLLDGTKLGGLLSEIHGTPRALTELPALVVGLGLNVNSVPPGLPRAATCLASAWRHHEDELGLPSALGRTRLVTDILAAIDRRYEAFSTGADLIPAWAARLDSLGRPVEARPAPGADGSVIRGMAVEVGPEGALIIETKDGERVTLRAGDVTLRKERDPKLLDPKLLGDPPQNQPA